MVLHNKTWYNKNFRFVFTPKIDDHQNFMLFPFEKKLRRFLIGAGAIHKYIGLKNADTVLKVAENSKKDKITLKFRKCGKIEIYVK